MPSLIRILQCRNKRIYPCTMRNCGWIWWVRNQWMQPNIDNSTSIMKLQIAVRPTALFEYWPRAPGQYYIFIIVVAYSIHMCSWAFENVGGHALPCQRCAGVHRTDNSSRFCSSFSPPLEPSGLAVLTNRCRFRIFLSFVFAFAFERQLLENWRSNLLDSYRRI